MCGIVMESEHYAIIYAAIIAGAVSIIGIGINIITNSYFRKKDSETEQCRWVTEALTNFYLPLARHLNKIKICLQNYLVAESSLTFKSLIEELAEVRESEGWSIKAVHDVKSCVNEFMEFISKEKLVYINHNLFSNYSLIDRFIFTLNMAIEEKIVSHDYNFDIDIINKFIEAIDNMSQNLTIHLHKNWRKNNG